MEFLLSYMHAVIENVALRVRQYECFSGNSRHIVRIIISKSVLLVNYHSSLIDC